MTDARSQARPMHLQTIESLLAELISGGAVQVDGSSSFTLQETASRAILNWYRTNPTKWAANVATKDIDAIVDSQTAATPTLPVPPLATTGKQRRLRLVRVEAHRFAGLHAYGTYEAPPPNFSFVPTKPMTLLEGWNGAGKTSLLNAIVWCLTGQLLRPQRPPEPGADEFDGHFTTTASDLDAVTTHGLTPITPLPDPNVYIPPAGKAIPLDTWVELTFSDSDNSILPPVRRTQVRNSRDKVTETVSGLDSLDVEPIALRTGTLMPAMLPYLRVGAVSELGIAAAKLTSLSDISSLAKHATKTREKLKGELRREREREITGFDARYNEALTDLQANIGANPFMAPETPLPSPSADLALEGKLKLVEQHFNEMKARALTSARTILGDGFDPLENRSRDDLERKIGPAQGQLKTLAQLPSARRLKSLAEIKENEWRAVDALLQQIYSEAQFLEEIAKAPALGRRKQLYARIADWIAEGGGHDFSNCDVCNRSLDGILDPVSQRAVSEHLAAVNATDRVLLSQNRERWVTAWVNRLVAQCPNALKAELSVELPTHPAQLMRTAVVDELFASEAFSGTLAPLKVGLQRLYDNECLALPEFVDPAIEPLPPLIAAIAGDLQDTMTRIRRAKAFANWRNENITAIAALMNSILRGPDVGETEVSETTPIGLKLDSLDKMVKGVAPLNGALVIVARMSLHLRSRRTAEKRLAQYDSAYTALAPLVTLGELADRQVALLRATLHERAVHWRDQCYGNAYATAGHGLRGTTMDAKGLLEVHVGSPLATAPAQHVSNASALRASVMGLFLALWEHILQRHGGLALLLLDDPQDLLDDDNRCKLARLLSGLAADEVQVIVTTYDRVFAREVVDAGRRGGVVEHKSVHPVNAGNNVLRTAGAVEELDRRRDAYLANIDDAIGAQNYASEIRVFLEARLADMFDDPSYPAYAYPSDAPTLSDYIARLRGLHRSCHNALFKGRGVTDFCDCPALKPGSDALTVLNKSHHRKQDLSAGDVYAVREELDMVRRLAERMHLEFRQFRWRDPLDEDDRGLTVVPLKPIEPAPFAVLIQPDLVAFTSYPGFHESQDSASESLTEAWFRDKSLFYICVDNLGFAVPAGCLAIVETIPSAGRDHSLVIARIPGNTLARRLLRSPSGGQLSLASEPPDRRQSKPTLVVEAGLTAVHRIVGLLTEQPPPPVGKGEAIEVTSAASLSSVVAAYRVRDDSGIPFALPGQIVLGGGQILADQLASAEGLLVALNLVDGSSYFKRVGQTVPGSAGKLRQFESVGGLGSSLVVSLTDGVYGDGLPVFSRARRIVGVLYAD